MSGPRRLHAKIVIDVCLLRLKRAWSSGAAAATTARSIRALPRHRPRHRRLAPVPRRRRPPPLPDAPRAGSCALSLELLVVLPPRHALPPPPGDARAESGSRDARSSRPLRAGVQQAPRTVGHLVAERYTSLLIDGEQHALGVLRYIALNPVTAGVARGPSMALEQLRSNDRPDAAAAVPRYRARRRMVRATAVRAAASARACGSIVTVGRRGLTPVPGVC